MFKRGFSSAAALILLHTLLQCSIANEVWIPLHKLSSHSIASSRGDDEPICENASVPPHSTVSLCYEDGSETETVIEEAPWAALRIIILFYQKNPQRAVALCLSNHPINALPKNFFDGFSNVIKLDLKSCRFSELPPGIQRLAHLSHLSIDDNNVQHLPPWIGNLSYLTAISAANNVISSLPIELGRLKKLKELKLSYNKLTELPLEMSNLDALEFLYIDNNEIVKFPFEFYMLTNLRILDVANNALSEVYIYPHLFPRLTSANFTGNNLNQTSTLLLSNFNQQRSQIMSW